MRRPKRQLIFASAALLSGLTVPAVATASLPRVVVAHVGPTYGAPSAPLTRDSIFDVVLQPQQAALNAYLAELTNPASANYRHFLTTAQFARQFGPSTSAIRAVRQYLEQNGLRVTHLSKAGTIIQAKGSTSNIAHAFSATLLTYKYKSITNLAFASDASLPQAVGQYVKTVVGLSGITTLHSKIARSQTTSRVSAPKFCNNNGSTDSSGTTPGSNGYDLTQQGRLYGLGPQWAAGKYGTGEKIAMYELQSYSPTDVSFYKSCYGLTNSIQAINVDGGPQSADNTRGLEEANLDIEEAAGLAPGSTILVYQGTQNIGSGALDTYAQIADDNSAQIVSSSWGSCEFDTSTQPAAEQLIFQQMAVQGQTVFSAAGDWGSSDCVSDTQISVPASSAAFPDTTLSVDDPSSQPYVTAVGGLSVQNITTLPTVWDVQCTEQVEPTSCNTARGQGAGGGGGGGISSVWSLPSWQQSAAANLSPAPTMRMVPDLSVMADLRTGFIVRDSGSWTAVGGTSIGSPLMSALLAVAANVCGVTNFGTINPTLYSMPSSSFVDVGSSNPNTNAVAYGITSYMSGAGYDLASGLGSPSATSSFITNLCPSGPQANHSVASVATSSLVANSTGTSLTVTARDRLNAPVPGASIGLNYASTATTPVIVNGVTDPAQPLVLTANGAGVATFTINSQTAGTVTLTPLIGAQAIGQPISISFSAPVVLRVPSVPTITRLAGLVKGVAVGLRAPSSNGGSAIIHYQYSLNAKSWITVGPATNFNITKLGQRVRYSIRVRAKNGVGFSPASSAKVFTTH